MLSAAQAIEFRRPLKSSPINEDLISSYRQHIDFIDEDRVISVDMNKSTHFLFNED